MKKNRFNMIINNVVLKRDSNKPILWDAFFKTNELKKPLVIFCHGYKGFKDWGAWNLVAREFMDAGCFFVKFNFSHNGGTAENPIDFPDLEAFAENNYSKELDDLNDVLEFFLRNENEYAHHIDSENVTVIGHSRGGGIAVLLASEDSRIKKLIIWAAVSDFGKRSSTTGDLEEWKNNGVKYVINGRTKQQMPHNYQFYQDFKTNEERLHIESAEKRLDIPHLIIHGKDDDSVAFSEAEFLNGWNSDSQLVPVENANHVFNTSHPWTSKLLPKEMETVVKKSINFINGK